MLLAARVKKPPSTSRQGSRLTWPEINQSEQYRGLWVALDACRYDARTAQPIEGTVVDADEDLVALCSRMQQGDNRHCAILFCDGAEAPVPPPRARLSSAPPSERRLAH
jgi:hypothetical protein